MIYHPTARRIADEAINNTYKVPGDRWQISSAA